MANFKRKKCKRQVRCTICTTNRWRGNSISGERWKSKDLSKAPQRDLDKMELL